MLATRPSAPLMRAPQKVQHPTAAARRGLAPASGAAPLQRRQRGMLPPVAAYRDEQEKAAGPGKQTVKPANQLEALKAVSVVVADTGEPQLVKQYRPQDCTTNPSLVYKAMQQPEYAHFLREALDQAKSDHRDPSHPFTGVADRLAVNIGSQMLKIVPGRVSTEVDARLSYDSKATYDRAMRIMDLYAAKGIGPDRIYIKLATTWEGVEAARRLQRQGVDCNMTLLFSFAQAQAAADAGAALISPFVGRILDWHKKHSGRDYAAHEDPGVLSVKRIYSHYKAHKIPTIVMAASFRNVGEIRELAGVDNITISPALLAELEASSDPLPRKLSPEGAESPDRDLRGEMSEKLFRELHGADQMAVDKLDEGIKGFAADQEKLEAQLAALAEKA